MNGSLGLCLFAGLMGLAAACEGPLDIEELETATGSILILSPDRLAR